VSTKALNQTVKRNTDRFPDEFLFRLSKEEAGAFSPQNRQGCGATLHTPGGWQERNWTPALAQNGPERRREA
jgi:hypothetical protein